MKKHKHLEKTAPAANSQGGVSSTFDEQYTKHAFNYDLQKGKLQTSWKTTHAANSQGGVSPDETYTKHALKDSLKYDLQKGQIQKTGKKGACSQ